MKVGKVVLGLNHFGFLQHLINTINNYGDFLSYRLVNEMNIYRFFSSKILNLSPNILYRI